MSTSHHSDNGAVARDKALELAQYVNDIQMQLDIENREVRLLKTAFLKNLENRYNKARLNVIYQVPDPVTILTLLIIFPSYTRMFLTTDRVAMMAIFAQWKMISSKSVFRKELAETEG